jgi:DNA-binding PadR family transcriptional regulator
MPDDPRAFLPLKHDVLMILLALGGGPRHGYGIMRDVEDRSDGEVVLQAGALYRTLKRLLGDGLVEECGAPPDVRDDDARRRYYRLTTLGGRVLDAEVERMDRLVRAARLTATGKRPRLA